MSRIISYRGLLADGGQDTIPLHTNDGKTGYKVVKFQLFPNQPGHTVNYESVIQIFKVKQTTVPVSGAIVDFGNLTLLGAAYYQDNNNDAYPSSLDIIFDNEVVNQDIYVTNTDNSAAGSMNYYIELEQVDLTEDQALVAIVKNLRNEQ